MALDGSVCNIALIFDHFDLFQVFTPQSQMKPDFYESHIIYENDEAQKTTLVWKTRTRLVWELLSKAISQYLTNQNQSVIRRSFTIISLC